MMDNFIGADSNISDGIICTIFDEICILMINSACYMFDIIEDIRVLC